MATEPLAYGDVLKDSTDGEVVMIVTPPSDGQNVHDILVLDAQKSVNAAAGSLTMEDFTGGPWQRIEWTRRR